MTERLLASLKAHANGRGLALVTEEALAEELLAGPEALRAELAKLERAGLIEVLSPSPFFVIKLRKWSGRRPDPGKTAPKSGAAEGRAYSFQSSLSASRDLKDSYRLSEGEAVLLKEILETLGETDATTFRGALKSYAPGVIREALARVRGMKTIRKNRTAVFRFLLPRIGKAFSSSN